MTTITLCAVFHADSLVASLLGCRRNVLAISTNSNCIWM